MRTSLTQLYPPTLWLWVTCGIKMMSLHHGRGWQPPQTASSIHIRHIQSAWVHWYAVHLHTVATIHRYTYPNPTSWLRFLGSGSLVESKWCHYIMVEVDSNLKLPPLSRLDIQSVWAHLYAVHRHMVAALHSYTHPPWHEFGGSGSLVESKWYHYIMVIVDADSHIKLLLVSIWDI